MPQWIFAPRRSERELAHTECPYTLERRLRETAQKHSALLDYIFHLVLEEYRFYEEARRKTDIEQRSRMLLEHRHWRRAKHMLRTLCQYGHTPEVLSFIKKKGLPRRILKP